MENKSKYKFLFRNLEALAILQAGTNKEETRICQ